MACLDPRSNLEPCLGVFSLPSHAIKRVWAAAPHLLCTRPGKPAPAWPTSQAPALPGFLGRGPGVVQTAALASHGKQISSEPVSVGGGFAGAAEFHRTDVTKCFSNVPHGTLDSLHLQTSLRGAVTPYNQPFAEPPCRLIHFTSPQTSLSSPLQEKAACSQSTASKNSHFQPKGSYSPST